IRSRLVGASGSVVSRAFSSRCWRETKVLTLLEMCVFRRWRKFLE
ncbi:hypothetical protein CpipJ_CPIJ002350, partial [Culex quinquefasciatus]